MSKRIYIDFGYLIVLAATFGAAIVLGVLVAPVVFHANNILVDMSMDHYNSGIVMGEVFHRFSYWLYFVTIAVVMYESALYKMGKRDAIAFGAAVSVVFSSLMFSSVYSPKILDMQAIGPEATQSDTFANIHLASEIDFKILAVGLIILFVRRLMLLGASIR